MKPISNCRSFGHLVCVAILVTAGSIKAQEAVDAASLIACYPVEKDKTAMAVGEVKSVVKDEDIAGFAAYAAYAWQKRELKVTFSDEAPQKVIDRIVEVMQQWNRYSGLKFVRGEAFPTGDIRVAFRKGKGNKSRIGRQAAYLPVSEPTMNLEDCLSTPPNSREFSRVVLHEFGHALGLAHEHQHPNPNCSEEIDWDLAFEFFDRKYHWPKATVTNNLMTISDTTGMRLSAIADTESIMRYYLDPAYLKKKSESKCYAKPRWVLSDGDKKAVRELYPIGSSGFSNEVAAGKLFALIGTNKLSKKSEVELKRWKTFWGQ